MKLTAVICTYDRVDVLSESLKSVARQTLATDEYEVVVVYNEDDDASEEYLSSASIPNLGTATEDAGSLSAARNVGYQVAQGEYVAYLDDDAVADPNWLESILETFETTNPEPSCVGGPVVGDLERPKPRWLPDSLPGLPVRNLGSEPRFLEFPDESVIGANMAFPRQFLEKHGGFSEELGRKEGTLLSNEETALQVLANRENGIFYQPAATVEHFIPADRLTVSYFLRRFYWQGISDCRVAQLEDSRDGVSPNGRLLGVLSQVPRAIRVVLGHLVSTDVSSHFYGLLWVVYCVGYGREQLRSAAPGTDR